MFTAKCSGERVQEIGRVEWVLFVWIMTGYIKLESESNAWKANRCFTKRLSHDTCRQVMTKEHNEEFCDTYFIRTVHNAASWHAVTHNTRIALQKCDLLDDDDADFNNFQMLFETSQ